MVDPLANCKKSSHLGMLVVPYVADNPFGRDLYFFLMFNVAFGVCVFGCELTTSFLLRCGNPLFLTINYHFFS